MKIDPYYISDENIAQGPQLLPQHVTFTTLISVLLRFSYCEIDAFCHLFNKAVTYVLYIHRVQKKRPPKHIKITPSNTIRFSKFFHCYSLLEICNKAVIKYPTTP